MRTATLSLWLGLLTAGIGISARAARTTTLPTYQINLRKTFPDSLAAGDLIGFSVEYKISLSNLDANEVYGRLEMVNAGQVGNFASAKQTSGGTTKSMALIYNLCGNRANSKSSQVSTNTNPTHDVPTPARFLLPGNGFTQVSSTIYFTGAFGTGSDQFKKVNISVGPTFRVVLENDRGAVIGTMSADVEGASSAAAANYCGGITITGPRDGGSEPPDNISPPMLLNGGRPF